MKKHLAIFSQNYSEQILNGEKVVESRFSKLKIPPFGQVSVGDIVYIKPAGEDIIGQFRVNKVINFEGFSYPEVLNLLKITNFDTAVQENVFLDKVKGCKYITIIYIGECTRFITSPIKIPKKDKRAWVVLD